MALLKTAHTKKKYFKIKDTHFKIYVKANSYKDGTVELTVCDCKKTIEIDFTLAEHSLNAIRETAMIAIKKLFSFHKSRYEPKALINIEKDLLKVVTDAAKFLGRPTYDYHNTDCQAMLIIGYLNDESNFKSQANDVY